MYQLHFKTVQGTDQKLEILQSILLKLVKIIRKCLYIVSDFEDIVLRDRFQILFLISSQFKRIN